MFHANIIKIKTHGTAEMGVDSNLGIDFGNDFQFDQILIMVTYMLAQYMIVTGEVLGNMRGAEVEDKSASFGRHKRVLKTK